MLLVERSKLWAANLAGRDRTGLTWDSVLWREAYCTASFVHGIHNCTYLSVRLFPAATRSQVTMCRDSKLVQNLRGRSHFCLFSLGLGNLKHYLQLLSYHASTYVNKPYGRFVFPKQEFGHQTIAEWSFQATWFQHWSWLGQDIERKLTMLNPPFFCTQGVQHTIMHMRNAHTTFILLPTALHCDSKADKHTHSSHLISDY